MVYSDIDLTPCTFCDKAECDLAYSGNKVFKWVNQNATELPFNLINKAMRSAVRPGTVEPKESTTIKAYSVKVKGPGSFKLVFHSRVQERLARLDVCHPKKAIPKNQNLTSPEDNCSYKPTGFYLPLVETEGDHKDFASGEYSHEYCPPEIIAWLILPPC